MAPILVRRVEHPHFNNRGPFQLDVANELGYRCPNLDAFKMPVPEDDGMQTWPSDFVFAVNDSGMTHFTEYDRARLFERGFVMNAFLCPPGTFVLGETQVAFDRSAAVHVQPQ